MSELSNESLICPITGEIMKDPVMALDGHTYEREAISTWFQEHQTSPLTGSHLESKTLITNHTLRKLNEEMGHETSYSSRSDNDNSNRHSCQTINFFQSETSINGRNSIYAGENHTCTHPCHNNYELTIGRELHYGGETEWRCPTCNKRIAYTYGKGYPMEFYYSSASS